MFSFCKMRHNQIRKTYKRLLITPKFIYEVFTLLIIKYKPFIIFKIMEFVAQKLGFLRCQEQVNSSHNIGKRQIDISGNF